jgi:hypothetical protein
MGIPAWIDVPEPENAEVVCTLRRAGALKSNARLGLKTRREMKKERENGYIAVHSTSIVYAEPIFPSANVMYDGGIPPLELPSPIIPIHSKSFLEYPTRLFT